MLGKLTCHVLSSVHKLLSKASETVGSLSRPFLIGLTLDLFFHQVLLDLMSCFIATRGSCIFCTNHFASSMKFFCITIGIHRFAGSLFYRVDTFLDHLASCIDRIASGILIFIGFVQLMSDLTGYHSILTNCFSALCFKLCAFFDLLCSFSRIRFSGTELLTHCLSTGSLILELPGMSLFLCGVLRLYSLTGPARISRIDTLIHLRFTFL